MTNDQPFLLKNIFSPTFVGQVAARFEQAWPTFDSNVFQKLVFDANWPTLELKQRMRHISLCLQKCLPPNYPDALAVVVGVAQNMLVEQGDKLLFEWFFLPDFVEVFGIEYPDLSLPALETITRVSSAEFAIRPFLLRYPERLYNQMQLWAKHESQMVRRLSSEGFRPRLPWGMGVPVLKKDPAPILPVLEMLKDDPAETVRRSVANNLNDISKDHPDLVLGIARRWLGKTPDTDWIVRHACRGLLKKGHIEALLLFGFDQANLQIVVESLRCMDSVVIGGVLHFSFLVKNTGSTSIDLRLEYAIDYLTLSGKISRKVFKIKELILAPDGAESFARHQRFTDFTTRKHFPGVHRLSVLTNGKEAAAVTFLVKKM